MQVNKTLNLAILFSAASKFELNTTYLDYVFMCIIRPSIAGPFFQRSCSKSEYELTES